MGTDLVERYRRDLRSEDPVVRTVAGRQLARLRWRPVRPPSPPRPSRWAHVPLADLFAEQGNRLHRRGDGRIESGHEPIHGSRSGRCVLIDPLLGRWWCRSCRRGGDAAGLVMDIHGCGYRQAAARLAAQHGPPSASRPDWRRRAFVAVIA